MNNEPAEDFFEITLSQQGANYVQRTFKIARWVTVLALVASSCYLFVNWIRYVKYYSKFDTKGSVILFIQFRIEPIFLAFTFIFSIAQIFYYFRFIQLCKRSIDTRQVDLFNHSFKWMLRNAVIVGIVVVINLLFAVFNAYAEVANLVNP